MCSFFKNKKKGFTLIELLAVVVILGVMMIIAVPSVSDYINESRKKTYVKMGQSYISETKNMIISRELKKMKKTDTVFYVPVSCLQTESGGEKTPYGDLEFAYVAVIYTNNDYRFYWTSTDSSRMGILLTPENLLDHNRVEGEISGISTLVGIGGRPKIKVLNEYCDVDFADDKIPSIDIDEDEYLTKDEMVGLEIDSETFKPTYVVSPNGWSQSKVVEIKFPGATDSEYSFDGGSTWLKYNGPLTLTENATIIAKSIIGKNYVKGNSLTISTIDSTPPTKATVSVTAKTSSSITIKASGTDSQSGVKYYQFSKDGGVTWSNVQDKNTYTFTGLESGSYNMKIRVINNTYANHGVSGNYKDSTVLVVDTKEIGEPVFAISPNTSNWVHKKTVKIEFEPGYTNKYSLDGGLTWTIYDEPLTFTGPASIIAKSEDGVNYRSSVVQSITHIDPTAPTAASFTYTTTSNSIKVIASGVDNESGIHHYQYSKDGGTTWTDVLDDSVYTFYGLRTGTYNIKVRVFNNTYTHHLVKDNYKDSGVIAVTTDSIAPPTYSIAPETGWATDKAVSINCSAGYNCEYSRDGTNWNAYTNPVVLNSNGTVIARINDGVNYVTASSQTVTNIDATPPVNLSFSTSKTSNSITVTATASDPESGIAYYQFSKNDGATWEPIQTSNVHTFNGLRSGTYNIRVRVVNGTYANNTFNDKNTTIANSQPVVTTTIPKAEYSISPDGWSQSKTVTITYPSGYDKTYSIDGGVTWKSYTGPVTVNSNCSIIARSSDGVNYVDGVTQTITTIDTTAPTAATFTTLVSSNSIKVTASGTDSQSGITRYQFSKNGGSSWESIQASNIFNFSFLTTGSYDIKVRVYNGTYDNNGSNNNYKDSSTVSVSTTQISEPTYSITPAGWSTSKTVTINYPSGYTNQYSLNGGSWTTYSGAISVTAPNTTIAARVHDGVNFVTAATQTITRIDRINPTCELEGIGDKTASGVFTNGATVQFKSKDGTGSSITQFGIGSLTGGATAQLLTTDASKTFTGYVKDSAGNQGTCSITLQGDSTAPSCSVDVTTNNSASGITFNWSCTDSGSGISGTASGTVSNRTSNWSKSVSDNAGNSKTITVNVASKTQYRYRYCSAYNCWYEEQSHCGFTSGCGGGCKVCAYSQKCKGQDSSRPYFCTSDVRQCDSTCVTWGAWSSWSDSTGSGDQSETRTVYYKSN